VRFLKFFHPCRATYLTDINEIGKTRGNEGLLKLTKFGVAMLIFGDIQPQQYLKKQPKYGSLLR